METLIQSIQNGNNKAYEQLRGQLWYTLEIASGYLAMNSEWMQEASTLLYKTAMAWEFPPEENFKASLYVLIRQKSDHFYYHNIKKHQNKGQQEVPENYPAESNQEMELDKAWVTERCSQLLQRTLDKVELQIITLYFYKGLTQQQLATRLKVSQPAIAQRIDTILFKLNQTPEFRMLWENSRHLY